MWWPIGGRGNLRGEVWGLTNGPRGHAAVSEPRPELQLRGFRTTDPSTQDTTPTGALFIVRRTHHRCDAHFVSSILQLREVGVIVLSPSTPSTLTPRPLSSHPLAVIATPPAPRRDMAPQDVRRNLAMLALGIASARGDILLPNATASSGTVSNATLSPASTGTFFGPVWRTGSAGTVMNRAECQVFVPQAGSQSMRLFLFRFNESSPGGPPLSPSLPLSESDGALACSVAGTFPASSSPDNFLTIGMACTGAAAELLPHQYYGLGVTADDGSGGPPSGVDPAALRFVSGSAPWSTDTASAANWTLWGGLYQSALSDSYAFSCELFGSALAPSPGPSPPGGEAGLVQVDTPTDVEAGVGFGFLAFLSLAAAVGIVLYRGPRAGVRKSEWGVSGGGSGGGYASSPRGAASDGTVATPTPWALAADTARAGSVRALQSHPIMSTPASGGSGVGGAVAVPIPPPPIVSPGNPFAAVMAGAGGGGGQGRREHVVNAMRGQNEG
jgi:hypothetical protein